MPEQSFSPHEEHRQPLEQEHVSRRWDIKDRVSRFFTHIGRTREIRTTRETGVVPVDPEHQARLIDEYINRDRSVVEVDEGQTIEIPTTVGVVKYSKEDSAWSTDRGQKVYDMKLFSDEFALDTENPGTIIRRTDGAEVLAGGKQRALESGRRVLDIASGEAVALLQYSKEFPETTFIGVDSGYDKFTSIDLNKAGVQLTKDDWSTLTSIPDRSIDTILSLQGALRWGVGYYGKPKEEELDVLKAITRVAKPGATLRYDIITEIDNMPGSTSRSIVENNNRVAELLDKFGWTVEFTHKSAVAVRRE